MRVCVALKCWFLRRLSFKFRIARTHIHNVGHLWSQCNSTFHIDFSWVKQFECKLSLLCWHEILAWIKVLTCKTNRVKTESPNGILSIGDVVLGLNASSPLKPVSDWHKVKRITKCSMVFRALNLVVSCAVGAYVRTVNFKASKDLNEKRFWPVVQWHTNQQ